MNKKLIVVIYVILIFSTQNIISIYASDNIFDYECIYDGTELYDVGKGNFNDYGNFKCAYKKNTMFTNINSENNYKNSTDNVYVYFFCEEIFKNFINDPSGEFINKAFDMPIDKSMVFEAMNVSNDTGLTEADNIRAILLNDDTYYIIYNTLNLQSFDHDFFFRKESLRFTSKENLQNILEENGVAEKIKDRAVINSPLYPTIIWIETERNCYFLVFNGYKYVEGRKYVELIPDENGDAIIEYSFYNKADFINKFSERIGKLIVDGKEIENSNAVFLYNENFYINTRALLEGLSGNEVIWDAEKKSIIFYLDNDKIEYLTQGFVKYEYPNNIEYSYTKYLKNDEPWVNTIWNCMYPFLIGESYFYKSDYIYALLKEYDRKYYVDTERGALIISPIDET